MIYILWSKIYQYVYYSRLYNINIHTIYKKIDVIFFNEWFLTLIYFKINYTAIIFILDISNQLSLFNSKSYVNFFLIFFTLNRRKYVFRLDKLLQNGIIIQKRLYTINIQMYQILITYYSIHAKNYNYLYL